MSEARRLLSATRDGAENQPDLRRSLLDEIAAQPQSRHGSTCSIALALRVLSEQDGADLVAALAGMYTNKAISAALRGRNVPVSYFTVGRHRRGECGCRASSTT